VFFRQDDGGRHDNGVFQLAQDGVRVKGDSPRRKLGGDERAFRVWQSKSSFSA
jgi:hypothetical protein